MYIVKYLKIYYLPTAEQGALSAAHWWYRKFHATIFQIYTGVVWVDYQLDKSHVFFDMEKF